MLSYLHINGTGNALTGAMKMYTYVYQVTVKPLENGTEPGAFAGVNFGETGYAELINMPDYNEIYLVYTDMRIDRQLDLAPGVVSYELVEEN